jgi:hypothetical protein
MLARRAGKPLNPLLAYLTRERRPPSVGMAFFLAVAIGLVGALLMLPPFLDAGQARAPWYSVVLLGLAWLVIASAPALAAVFAALLTARWLRLETHQLLRLTALSARLPRTYLLAVLFRLRALIALALGLTPLLLAGLTRRTLIWSIGPSGFFSPFTISKSLPLVPLKLVVWRFDRIGWMPELYGWAIGAWGALLLGAALGTTLALLFRRPVPAALLSSWLTLSFTLALLAVIPIVPLDGLARSLRLAGSALIALVPYALGTGVICLLPVQ